MPTYQVVTPWNPSVKVNDKFTTERLHPSLRQHVVELADGVEERKQQKEELPPPKKAEDEGLDLVALQEARDKLPNPLPLPMLNKLHAEAIKEDAKRFPAN